MSEATSAVGFKRYLEVPPHNTVGQEIGCGQNGDSIAGCDMIWHHILLPRKGREFVDL